MKKHGLWLLVAALVLFSYGKSHIQKYYGKLASSQEL